MLRSPAGPAHPFDGLGPQRPSPEPTAADTLPWSEEEIVQLHWRLLMEIRSLPNPMAPLEQKIDTLRWVFAEPEKRCKPFSFESCLRVVGCSPLSPLPFFGLVNAQEIRDHIAYHLRGWLRSTLDRYPPWVREAVARHPEWVEEQLERNPQCINEQLRRQCGQTALFQ